MPFLETLVNTNIMLGLKIRQSYATKKNFARTPTRETKFELARTAGVPYTLAKVSTKCKIQILA